MERKRGGEAIRRSDLLGSFPTSGNKRTRIFGEQGRGVEKGTGKVSKRSGGEEVQLIGDARAANGFSTLLDLCLRKVLIDLDRLDFTELSNVISSNLESEVTQKLLLELLNRLNGSESKEAGQLNALKEFASAELFKLFEHLVFTHQKEYALEFFCPQDSKRFQRIVVLLKAMCSVHKNLDNRYLAQMLISLVIYRVENAQLGGMPVAIGTMFLNSLSNDELERLSVMIERVVSMLKPDIKRRLEAFATTIRISIQGRMHDAYIEQDAFAH